jgi:hypothetical protein
MKRFIRSIFFCCMLCVASPVVAVMVPNINSGSILVADRNNQTLQASIPKAMQQVLIKNSGQVDISAMPNVQQFLAGASNLVSSYYYTPHPETPETPWQLNVTFARKSVEKYLLDSNLSLWNADRPLTLCYVYINDGTTTQVLNSQDAPLQTKFMQQMADDRGVPLSWPNYDQQDQQNLSLTKPPTAEFTLNTIQQNLLDYLFKRYAVHAVLYGVVWNSGINWYGSWYINFNKQIKTWTTDGPDVNTVLGNSVAQLANFLSGQMVVYAANDATSAEYSVWISNVNGLQGYTNAMRLLQGLTPVSSVAVSELDANGVLFKVNTKVGLSGLLRLLQQSNAVQQINGPIPSQAPVADAYFQWQP